MKYARSLFIFRRDLRIEDNTALIRAFELSREVGAVFIFDPRQCEVHDYFSPKAYQFLKESIEVLSFSIQKKQGRLYLFYGKAESVVEELLALNKFDAVFINKDYTPFSRRRDEAIRKTALKRGAAFEEYEDALLYPPGTVLKKEGGPYTIFTPFYKKALQLGVLLPQRAVCDHFMKVDIRSSFVLKPGQLKEYPDEKNLIRGGRGEGVAILERLGAFREYAVMRDIPASDATTKLSAHHKFGTVSVRESFKAVFDVLGGDHPLLRQLFWRDFFSHIAYYFPHVFGHAFYDEYDHILWMNDEGLFKAWCEGRTGFGIVDAGMRELNATGFMHNRVRMIAASFLVKDLHIDWRWGEKYFAQKLVDYDPSVNNGNWQWAASTGCDHQPYFRIFNPALQAARFDPKGVYTARWVPEIGTLKYPPPCITHPDACAWTKRVFKEASRRYKRD